MRRKCKKISLIIDDNRMVLKQNLWNKNLIKQMPLVKHSIQGILFLLENPPSAIMVWNSGCPMMGHEPNVSRQMFCWVATSSKSHVGSTHIVVGCSHHGHHVYYSASKLTQNGRPQGIARLPKAKWHQLEVQTQWTYTCLDIANK